MRKPIVGLGRFKLIGKENQPLSAREDPEPSVSDVDEHLILYPIRKAASHDPDTKAFASIRSHSPSHSALPESNRFYPFHEPRKGPPTEDFIGTPPALQFLPSYEESTPGYNGQVFNTKSNAKSSIKNRKSREKTISKDELENPSAKTTWDAVIEADDGSKSSKGSWRSRKKSTHGNSRDSISSSEGKKSSRLNTLASRRRGKAKKNVRGPPKFILSDDVSQADNASDFDTTSKKGHRIARLASMFGNRTVKAEKVNRYGAGTTRAAAVKQKTLINADGRIPSSPAVSNASSSSSAGFAGWPGTQDKQGKVVAIESSYDDSSVGFIAFKDPGAFSTKFDIDRNSVMTSSNHAKDISVRETDFRLQSIVQDLRSKPKEKKAQALPHERKAEKMVSNLKQVDQSSVLNPLNSIREPVEGTSVADTSASTALSILNLFDRDSHPRQASYTYKEVDPWDVDNSSHAPSSPGTSVSKNSSEFFHMDRGLPNQGNTTFADLDSFYGVRTNIKGVESILRRKPQEIQPPTLKALGVQNHAHPALRVFKNSRGFHGLYDKRAEVPNLMDDDIDDSDSLASEPANAEPISPLMNELSSQVTHDSRKNQWTEFDEESDVFDDISRFGNSQSELQNIENSNTSSILTLPNGSKVQRITPEPILSKTIIKDDGRVNLVTLPGGLQAIQTSQKDYKMRHKSNDFDENLSISDIDQHGFIKVPGVDKMINAGRKMGDSASYVSADVDVKVTGRHASRPFHITLPGNFKRELQKEVSPGKKERNLTVHLVNQRMTSLKGTELHDLTGDKHATLDLSHYKIHPDQSKKLIRAYREISEAVETEDMTLDRFNEFEDSKKAFALSEMRSRIMEKDLDRGLERRGGSVHVDDIVLTPYFQASHRVRDIVIVSKAWRDGATPYDVVAALNMTRRNEKTYYVPRISESNTSTSGRYIGASYWWEKVAWIDDTDVTQMRCPSLGSRNMRGFEIFSIGDCQSILLKLTHEQCANLRMDLEDATRHQIDAEDRMKEDFEAGDEIMTDSEIWYLTAMEDVKAISKKLAIAEKSFNMVRTRIEKLISRYKELLSKMEDESVATDSLISDDESCYSDEYYSNVSFSDDRSYSIEQNHLQKRARRAELRAELAAREANLARLEITRLKEEKQKEVEALQLKLMELKSESASGLDHSMILTKAIKSKQNGLSAGSHHSQSITNLPEDRINDVKRKFRERMAERLKSPMKSEQVVPDQAKSYSRNTVHERTFDATNLCSQRRMLVGEEMYQHLEFYTRSLQAVNS